MDTYEESGFLEYPDKGPIQDYMDHQRSMDRACERITTDFRAWVAQWVTTKAKETGLETSLDGGVLPGKSYMR